VQHVTETSPDLSVLCTQHTQSSFGRILNWYFLRVIDNDLKIESNVLFRHDQIVVVIQNVEPVELAITHDDHVLRSWVLTDLTSMLSGYPGSTEQS